MEKTDFILCCIKLVFCVVLCHFNFWCIEFGYFMLYFKLCYIVLSYFMFSCIVFGYFLLLVISSCVVMYSALLSHAVLCFPLYSYSSFCHLILYTVTTWFVILSFLEYLMLMIFQ